ncbi:hypothetical protein BTS2_1188 [Bacillus sp. TS-2]|nr:hypothetical protein BTS2_1188 [Bacillus sp. TS-2]
MNGMIHAHEGVTSSEYQTFAKVVNQLLLHLPHTPSMAILLIQDSTLKISYDRGISPEIKLTIQNKCIDLEKKKDSTYLDGTFEYMIKEILYEGELSTLCIVFPEQLWNTLEKQTVLKSLTDEVLITSQHESFLEEATTNILKQTNFRIDWTSLAEGLVDVVKNTYYQTVSVTILEKVGTDLMITATTNEVFQNTDFVPITTIKQKNSRVFYTIIKNVGPFQHFLAIALKKDSAFYGYLLFGSSPSFTRDQSFLRKIEKHSNDMIELFIQGYELEKAQYHSRNQDLLLQVTKKLHSSMNIGEVLNDIIEVIKDVFPGFSVKVMLSHEWQGDESMNIYLLNYRDNEENKTVEKVYLTGTIEIDVNEKHNKKSVYVPLRGRQGIYGVLEISSPQQQFFTKSELSFIELLADIGGNAFENTELYQQSQRLIHDLQLINEMSQEINSNLKMSDTVHFIISQIVDSFHAEEVGILMMNDNQATLIKGSTTYFEKQGINEYIDRLIKKVIEEQEAVYLGDSRKERGFESFDYQSILAIPMKRMKELKGIFIVMHKKPFHFSFDNFKLLRSLIHHCTLAFSNSIMHEELERLVITDHLTGLYTRSYLDGQIEQSLANDMKGTFLLLDIDNFKNINDTFGHQVGDDILKQVAQLMKDKTRAHDIVARWGGEELAIYLPRIDKEAGHLIAQRIVESVALHTEPKVTVSCGVAHWEARNIDKIGVKTLVDQADKALYVAKNGGKNQVIS